MKELTIRSNEAGQRLDKFLAKYMNLAPKSFFYKMLRKKNITLNGKKAAGPEKLSEGDIVRLFLSDDTISKFSRREEAVLPSETDRYKLDIIYEDEHTVFMNKPAGILSQKAGCKDVSMVEYLTAYLLKSGQITQEDLHTFHPAVCNRLDRNTSGILAGGKTLEALQTLSAMFRERSLEKYYLCLVDGILEGPAHICGYLIKDGKTNRVTFMKEAFPGAEHIETEYRPLCSSGGVTLAEVHLLTGKTHQIRAHMASQGHPVIGDYKYGNRKINDEFKRKYGLSYQFLHAYKLCFPEISGPLFRLSGKTLTAPLPSLFRKICTEIHINFERAYK